MGKPLVGKRKRGHVIRRQKAREPQMVERVKKVLLVRGNKTGPFGLEVLRDLRRIKGAENSILFSRKNDILPFEDETRMEFLCDKNDCGIFVLANHTKKRPNNLVLGRLFDNQTLDMVEVGVSDFVSFQEMLKRSPVTKALGSQSAIIFQGDDFDKNLEMQSLRSMLLDLFKDRLREQVDLCSLDHVVVCSAVNGMVYIRNYVLAFTADNKASKTPKVASVEMFGKKIPGFKLLDMGPSIDLKVRRARLPAPDLSKLAHRQPKNPSAIKKVKNVSHDELQGKMGRIHMKKQDMNKLVTRSRFKKALGRGSDEQES